MCVNHLERCKTSNFFFTVFAFCQVGGGLALLKEEFATNSFHLALAMVMAAFTVFQVLPVTFSCQV